MSFALNVFAKSTLILLCAWMLSLLLRRASASTRHAAWILAMTAALALPALVLVVPQFEWPVLPQTSTSVTFLPLDTASAEATAAASAPLSSAAPLPLTLRFPAALVWLMGMVFLIVRFAMSAIAVRRLAKSASPAANDDWNDLIHELRLALGVKATVRVLFGDPKATPMTWGVARNTILLPSSATSWPEERRRVVLAHELAHVKRNDGLKQVFVQLVCGIYWFNPLVWYAAHRVRIERERACDDQVLRLGAAAAEYADHLIQIVRGLRGQPALSRAAVSMAQPSQLETRLVSILDSSARRRTLSKAGAGALLALTSLLTISIAAIGVTTAVAMPPVLAPATRAEPPAVTPAPAKAAPPQRARIGNAGTATNATIVPPRVLQSDPPMYTPEAVAARWQGTVTLEGTVDVQGKVRGLRVIKGLGFGLDRMAIKAALGWKFSPALSNGQAVDAITQIEVDFRLPPRKKDLVLKVDAADADASSQQPGKENAAAAEESEPPVRIGPGVTPPTVVFRVEPQYTPEARDAKYQGTVVVRATIHPDGTLTVDDVVRGLDYGLTEKAIEALQEWKFRPGMKDGKAVAVTLNIEVNFNLK